MGQVVKYTYDTFKLLKVVYKSCSLSLLFLCFKKLYKILKPVLVGPQIAKKKKKKSYLFTFFFFHFLVLVATKKKIKITFLSFYFSLGACGRKKKEDKISFKKKKYDFFSSFFKILSADYNILLQLIFILYFRLNTQIFEGIFFFFFFRRPPNIVHRFC